MELVELVGRGVGPLEDEGGRTYDIDRQLERGYTLTLTAAGELVRSAGALPVGSELVTRFADGTARSRIESAAVRDGGAEEGNEGNEENEERA